jgi:hypothetical protein
MQEALAFVTPLLKRAEAVDFRNQVVMAAEQSQRRLQLEIDSLTEMNDLSEGLDPMAVEKAVARANGLNLNHTPDYKMLDARLKKLRTQLPLQLAMKNLLAELKATPEALNTVPESTATDSPSGNNTQFDGAKIVELSGVVTAIKEAGLDKAKDEKTSWLPELDGEALFERCVKTIDKARKARSRDKKKRAKNMLDEAKRTLATQKSKVVEEEVSNKKAEIKDSPSDASNKRPEFKLTVPLDDLIVQSIDGDVSPTHEGSGSPVRISSSRSIISDFDDDCDNA